MKHCSKCDTSKTFDEFNKNKRSKDGLGHWCRLCSNEATRKWYQDNLEENRAKGRQWAKDHPDKGKAWRNGAGKRSVWSAQLRHKFGIDAGTYDALLIYQDMECAICRTAPIEKNFGVDHSHITDVVRGLLCDSCNIGLGKFQDNPIFLAKAIQYLLDPPAVRIIGERRIPNRKAQA